MTKEDTPLPLLSDDPTPIAFKHYDILVGSDGNSIQALTEGIGPTGNRVTKSENGSTLYGQLLSRDAKIAHLQSLNELKYNEGFTEASRIAGAKIKSLEGLVQVQQGCRLTELRHAWEQGFKLAVGYADNHFHFAGEQKERQWQKFLAAISSAKALDFQPTTT